MTLQRFNDLIRVIDVHYNYLKPFVCETSLEKDRSKEEMPIILHLARVPSSLANDLFKLGFSSTAFPDTFPYVSLWVGDITIHYHSTLNDYHSTLKD